MKITDVTLTLFAWENIPSTTYGRHTGKFGGQSQLGLLKVRESDFIFAHASGMFGFVGMIGLMIAFVILLLRVIHVAEIALEDSADPLQVAQERPLPNANRQIPTTTSR